MHKKSWHDTLLGMNRGPLWLAVVTFIAGMCTIAINGVHNLSTSASTSFIAYVLFMAMIVYYATLRLREDKHRECIRRIKKALDYEYSKLGL